MSQLHVDFGGYPALDSLCEVVDKLVPAALAAGTGRQPRLHAEDGAEKAVGLLYLWTNKHTHGQSSQSPLTISGFIWGDTEAEANTG